MKREATKELVLKQLYSRSYGKIHKKDVLIRFLCSELARIEIRLMQAHYDFMDELQALMDKKKPFVPIGYGEQPDYYQMRFARGPCPDTLELQQLGWRNQQLKEYLEDECIQMKIIREA